MQMKVSQVMTGEVATLSPEQTLEEAAKFLLEHKVSGVPVVKDSSVVGMLSEKDLLSLHLEPRPPRYLELLGGIIYLDDVREFQEQLAKTAATRVEEVMTQEVVTVDANASLEEAARLILERGINRIPVLEGGHLVGIVTRSDVLRGSVEQ